MVFGTWLADLMVKVLTKYQIPSTNGQIPIFVYLDILAGDRAPSPASRDRDVGENADH